MEDCGWNNVVLSYLIFEECHCNIHQFRSSTYYIFLLYTGFNTMHWHYKSPFLRGSRDNAVSGIPADQHHSCLKVFQLLTVASSTGLLCLCAAPLHSSCNMRLLIIHSVFQPAKFLIPVSNSSVELPLIYIRLRYSCTNQLTMHHNYLPILPCVYFIFL